MFCAKCGKRVDEGSRFCPACGTEIPGMADDANEASSDIPFLKRDLTANISGELWYKLLYATVVVISVACAIYFKVRKSESAAATKGGAVTPQPSITTQIVREVIVKTQPNVSKPVVAQGTPPQNGDITNQQGQSAPDNSTSTPEHCLWNDYKIFLDANYTSLKRDAEWEKFAGKQMTCVGRFQDAGKALLGGIYVTVIVDGKWVKLMIDPSQTDKAISLQKGDRITVEGRVSSRGDLFHVITLEQGFIKR